MGTDVFLLTKPAGCNSIQRACTQAMSTPTMAVNLSINANIGRSLLRSFKKHMQVHFIILLYKDIT